MSEQPGSHFTPAVQEQPGAMTVAPRTSTPLKSSGNPLHSWTSPTDGTFAGGVLSSPQHPKSNQLHMATSDELTPLSPAGGTNQGNVTTSSGPVCRICHEGDQEKPLLSLCLCSGTVGLVHTSCLEHWLCTSGSEHCEICRHHFKVERRQRDFGEWLRGSSRGARRSLLGDVICFVLLTPLAFLCGGLCLYGAAQKIVKHRFWEAMGLTTLSFLLFAVYLVWCVLTSHYHYEIWKKWQSSNYRVRIFQGHGIESPPVTEEAGLREISLVPTVPALLLSVAPVASMTDLPAARRSDSNLSPLFSHMCNSRNSVSVVSTLWQYRTSQF